MKSKTFIVHRKAMPSHAVKGRASRRIGLFALLTSTLFISSCGGGGDAQPTVERVPLVWDEALSTWDNVNWQ